jgi:hypothetical protein
VAFAVEHEFVFGQRSGIDLGFFGASADINVSSFV